MKDVINTIRGSIQHNAVASYFILSYLLTWLVWIPLIFLEDGPQTLRMVGGFGPSVAALLLIGMIHGRSGYKSLWGDLTRWRVGWIWYLIAFFGTPFLAILALSTNILIGADPGSLHLLQPWYVLFIAFGYVLVTSVIGEEIGWRGFALPRLQSRFSAFASSLLLATVWSLWHLPLFFIGGDFHSQIPLVIFLGQGFLITILLTWLYNNTEGSLIIAHIFHTSSNITFFMLPILPPDTGGDLRPMILMLIIAAIFIAGILAKFGPGTLAGTRGKVKTIDHN